MIGIIVTGHGGFASGMAENVKMLSGVDVKAIDFKEGITPEELDVKIVEAISSLEDCANIVIFTDIPGGTPYNRSVMVSLNNPKVRIVAGTNVPMLLDAAIKNLSDSSYESTDELVDALMETAKEGVVKFVVPALNNNEEEDFEDGI
ncbi:MAG: PTS sugar transporter subunit IIA [Erysipelotrichaceae bacterium]|nr:PTS sugar transporter subunit IIA [Erysipelotrichaceae bacterium]